MIDIKTIWPPRGREHATGYLAQCPAHNDPQQSLHVMQKSNGKVVLHCFAGCAKPAILAATGLTWADVMGDIPVSRDTESIIKREALQHRIRQARENAKNRAKNAKPKEPATGCTLRQYAEAKMLSPLFLLQLGIKETMNGGVNALMIPYRGLMNEWVGARYRRGLTGDRFRWETGSKPGLYGLWRLPRNPFTPMVIVEGESDCHVLWQNGIDAVGVPGASHWDDARDGEALKRFAFLVCAPEPDAGGDAMRKSFEKSVLAPRLLFFSIVGAKDPADLWVKMEASPERFRAFWQSTIQQVWRLDSPLIKA